MTDPLALAIVREGLDDWVPLIAVDGSARQLGASSDQEIISRTIDSIRWLIQQGLVTVGDVTYEGFIPWTLAADSAMAQIELARRTHELDYWSYYCWLCNTPAGDAYARRP